MENTPRQYRSGGRRKRRRRRSPLPLFLLIALLVTAIAVGVASCRGRENTGEPFSGSVASGMESRPESGATSAPSEDPSSTGVGTKPTSHSEEGSSMQESAPASEPESSSDSAEPTDAAGQDWRLVLVNASNRLSGDYDVELAGVTGNYQLDARIVDDTKAMLAAAKEAGYTLQICSAYRSTERSGVLYGNKVAQYKSAGYSDEDAAVEAAKWVAPPGTSEHNTGLSADIVSGDYFTKHADLEHVFETFDEFKWLYENCAEYGFILRYPKDKQEITGITYEPWHYRYVGKENAKKIMEQGICLEEFLGEA